MMKKYRKPYLGIWMFALLLLSLSANAINLGGNYPKNTTVGDSTSLVEVPKPQQRSQRSLSEVLNPDGTLKANSNGSFNATGFKISYGKNGQPVFLPSATLSDDDNWSALGTGLNNFVNAVAVSGTDVYVGGGFTAAGGDSNIKYIAKWNGSAWSVLGSGLNSGVNVIVVSGTDVYVGGAFTTAGGIEANGIAKWNSTTSTWSALGTGVENYTSVFAIAVSGTDIYVGGAFTKAGGSTANGIAKWNGSSWSTLGTGVSGGDVHAIAVSGTDVYVGGGFNQVGINYIAYIAKWNGSTWSALGTGVSGGNVYAITVSGADVYVGGQFTMAGGIAAKGIAKWDSANNAWSALGSGVNNTVRAITVSGTGVYVGGDFSTVGGNTANRIAKWDGSGWSALGTGVSGGNVYAIAVSGTDVYAGGVFTTAGSSAASRIAAYHGSPLPVNLLSYTAKADGNDAKLQWQTAQEVNNKGFEIWRGAESEKQKAESTTFVKIGEVSASHISNLASQIYNYTDKSPLNGNNYYKLVQIDNDGKATELGIKTVTFNFQPTTFNLYPNPATHNITLNLGNKKGTLTISDALGRAKATLGYHASAITLDISAYPSGVYFYQLGNVKGKFIKQ